MWSADSGDQIRTMDAHVMPVYAMEWNGNGSLLASAGSNCYLLTDSEVSLMTAFFVVFLSLFHSPAPFCAFGATCVS